MKRRHSLKCGLAAGVAERGIMVFSAFCVMSGAAAVFHVSPEGDDASDGLTPASAFRPLERARDSVREIHRRPPGEKCRVKIAAGRHPRKAPFVLAGEDVDFRLIFT